METSKKAWSLQIVWKKICNDMNSHEMLNLLAFLAIFSTSIWSHWLRSDKFKTAFTEMKPKTSSDKDCSLTTSKTWNFRRLRGRFMTLDLTRKSCSFSSGKSVARKSLGQEHLEKIWCKKAKSEKAFTS